MEGERTWLDWILDESALDIWALAPWPAFSTWIERDEMGSVTVAGGSTRDGSEECEEDGEEWCQSRRDELTGHCGLS